MLLLPVLITLIQLKWSSFFRPMICARNWILVSRQGPDIRWGSFTVRSIAQRHPPCRLYIDDSSFRVRHTGLLRSDFAIHEQCGSGVPLWLPAPMLKDTAVHSVS